MPKVKFGEGDTKSIFGGIVQGKDQNNPSKSLLDKAVSRPSASQVSSNVPDTPSPTPEAPTAPEGFVSNTNVQQTFEDLARGTTGPSEASKPEVARIDVDQGITKQNKIQQIDGPSDISGERADADVGIDVTTGKTALSRQPSVVKPSTVTAAKIRNAPVIKAAQGAVSKIASAEAPDFDPNLEGQAITQDEIKDGFALNVEGALSSGAFAEAAKGEAAQIDTGQLPRLEDIDLMPSPVQAEVAELPEEALVSTQMNSLLEGMEKGITPAWARPALEAVEQQLAERGMSASTVGRNALFAAIVSSALPIAQGNAQAIKERAAQNLANKQQAALQTGAQEFQAGVVQFQTTAQLETINAQLAQAMNVANLDAAQQTAIFNASTQANMDMTKFTTEQQVELANSKWMQTASLQNLDNRQQAVLQEATLLAQQEIAGADLLTRVSIENAKNFLAMDMTNLNNQQQAAVLNQQARLQTMLSNQAAENAASQFNASSRNQVNMFMSNLAAEVDRYNTTQANAMTQFNVTQKNAAAAQEANNRVDLAKFNAQLQTQIDQFNAEKEFQTEQWNAANAQAIEQSNIQWRRQANTADTAAENAINQQNALNAFGLQKGALDALWQQLRDEASFEQQNWVNYQTQVANLYATAIGHEKYTSNRIDEVAKLVQTFRVSFGGEG